MRQLLQQVSRRRVRLVVLLWHLSVRQRALVVLRVVLLVDSRAGPLCNELQRGVTDGNREAKGEIKHAALAAVLEACARETDLTAQPVSKSVFATRWWGRMEEGGKTNIRLLEPTRPVRRPAEHGEWARADLALHATVLLDHLDERIVRCGEAIIADGGEIRDFGTAAVYV